jgi:hypothetical protein
MSILESLDFAQTINRAAERAGVQITKSENNNHNFGRTAALSLAIQLRKLMEQQREQSEDRSQAANKHKG